MNLLNKDGTILYFNDFFSKNEADHYFNLLINNISWKQEPIKIFGKSILQPRLTALYGDSDQSYSYSGITMLTQKWTESLTQIKLKVESKINDLNIYNHLPKNSIFNIALLNFYRHQQDSMGWHRDNEKELGPNPLIASVSFGETREFQIRHYFDKPNKVKINLSHGSLLLMYDQSQDFWEHCLPKKMTFKEPRINITFRTIRKY